MIHFNGHDISSIHYGAREITKVYQGTRLVWEAQKYITGTASGTSSVSYHPNGNTGTASVAVTDGKFKIPCPKNLTSVRTMFSDFASRIYVTSLDLRNLDVSGVTDFFGMLFYIGHNNGWTTINVTGWDLSAAENFNFIFPWDLTHPVADVIGLETLDTSHAQYFYGLLMYISDTSYDARWLKLGNALSIECLFNKSPNLATVNVTGWDTSKVTNFRGVFSDCHSLATITGIQTWNTAAGQNFESMFYNCKELALDGIRYWDTSNATNMGSMFSGCAMLKGEIFFDLRNWDMSKVTTTNSMFAGCSSLEQVWFYYESFNPGDFTALTDATDMFKGCTSLTKIMLKDDSWHCDLDLSDCPIEYLGRWPNYLATVTEARTIKFSAACYAQLSAYNIAQYTAKGWTVVSA